MVLKNVTRFLHSSKILFDISKSNLSILRKKTGFTFANCKKALELHHNNINKAEEWLNQQAQAMGWLKATKLEGRITTQGLIGVLIKGNIGAMVEINCETDFVARNGHFRKFVDHTAQICAQYTELTNFDGDLWKLGFESEALQNLKISDDKTLGDLLALVIGTVGENASIKRAICFKTNNELKLSGYVHPTVNTNIENNVTQYGRYGAIVAFRTNSTNEELQKNLCQHIVGMNPDKIGEYGRDEPRKNKDDEKCLIYQEYLLDPDNTVGDVLKNNNIEIIDFQRYECGESFKDEKMNIVKATN